MKKKIFAVVIAGLLAANAALSARYLILDAQAGSAADPLVSKSYVDAQIAALRSEFSALSQNGGGEVYIPVPVSAGQIIFGGGGTEIVLRSGIAAAYVPGLNGLLDISDGVDLLNGAPLLINHMVIIPRDDGRGVIALADAWFMVKGDYRVVN